jgi:hypothetical protein
MALHRDIQKPSYDNLTTNFKVEKCFSYENQAETFKITIVIWHRCPNNDLKLFVSSLENSSPDNFQLFQLLDEIKQILLKTFFLLIFFNAQTY